MQKLDTTVISTLIDKFFTPERICTMMAEMRKHYHTSQANQSSRLKPLQKELESLKLRSERLYEAVEKGFLPMDETLQERAHKIQARRQEVLLEIAGLKRAKQMPTDLLKPKNIAAFTKAITTKLLDTNSRFAKDYLKLLIKEIKIEGKVATITGSYNALATAIAETKKDTHRVPTFVYVWLLNLGSNQGHMD